ncbi:Stk1 family PASTA domain-containing Ser/Thr kinase [Atopococcus tabaci]|uniref:Stk1 family PASTA domain-containing Ser/Thr kinase n=1 Tax=Atopococcus tabaci TaxID=269774 RepID=UPI000404ECC7|nr:Stk1 family PASTA domain-containing Ser/Thr kinase [Atopococcus tabaci]
MEIGQRINGRYRILKPVGSGGMANVYLAEDLILERQVAVKLMRYDFRNDESSIRRFKREALASTELIHPNIVSIYDVGQEDDNPYIVMEYIKGTDLKEYIRENYPIPYKKALDIMGQILSAVEYAHQNGLIHRDLKPQNILIDDDDYVKITDFGIAIALSQNSITQTNSLLGSVHYISPEQARGGMATKQSDVYSLGILLFELLTGNVPFDGESAVSIVLKHFQEPIPSIRESDPHIPQALENVVLKATAKEKEQRYQTVQEMADDLETSLSPERADEPKFIPVNTSMEETKQFQPISVDGDTASGKTAETTVIAPVPDADKVQTQPEENKKKKRKKWLIPVLLLLATFAAFLVFLLSGTDDVQVPDVSGMTEAEAVQALMQANLVLGETILESSEEVEEGRVTRTSPAGDSTVKEDAAVDLFISTGKETVEFQDYTGEPFEEARARLTELGFIVEQENESSDTVEAGYIISQDIEAGDEVVPEETTVTLTVSEGRAGFELRDLANYSLRGVQDYVRDHDLNVTVEEAHSDSVPEGQVISQKPEAGTLVYADSHISVVMSLGPEEIQYETIDVTVPIPYKAPEETEQDSSEEQPAEGENGEKENSGEPQETRTPNTIQIFIEDTENNLDSPYRELEITEDTEVTLNLTLEEGTKGRYRIVRDGETIIEEEVEA